ncbi:hypothetical protein B9479_006464 [Cryptococcus floricola]|uniref:Uncharacterized protein n=1 Tax=Cryptococcus floricola TaxID=2591691 RepID=A0A5D3AN35_9TREE|nr:hypothetical protein B9479_006464 [Cryptococcus floricola]
MPSPAPTNPSPPTTTHSSLHDEHADRAEDDVTEEKEEERDNPTAKEKKKGKKTAKSATEEERKIIDEVLMDILSAIRNDFEQKNITSIDPRDFEGEKWRSNVKASKQAPMTTFEIKELLWWEVTKRAERDEPLTNKVTLDIYKPSYWKGRWYTLRKDWYDPISDTRNESGCNFYDGMLRLSDEEWVAKINADNRYSKLKTEPFHHFDSMRYILDQQTASGVNAGPKRSRPSGPSQIHRPANPSPSGFASHHSASRSPSPISSSQQASSRRRAPQYATETTNLSQRQKRVAQKRKAEEEEEGREDDDDDDVWTGEEENQLDKREKRARRGWPKGEDKKKGGQGDDDISMMGEAVLGMLELLGKHLSGEGKESRNGGTWELIASWLEKRDGFDDSLKGRVLDRCLEDDRCAEQVLQVVKGCKNR